MTRRQYRRIAKILREAIEIVHDQDDCVDLHSMILRRLMANVIFHKYEWLDLTVDVCVALATVSGPTEAFTFPIRARKLAVRVCRLAPSWPYKAPKEWYPIRSDWDVRMYAYGLIARNVQ